MHIKFQHLLTQKRKTKMTTQNISDNINQLRSIIESVTGKTLSTPKDFKQLSDKVYLQTHALISPSTLMRIWGYIESDVQPRTSTLSLLARFAGYRDWEDFTQSKHDNRQSSVVVCRHLNVTTDIRRGQKLRLRWLPDRTCDIVYLGNMHFKVIASENTGLKKDATFMCALIIEGEPLYLDEVEQHDMPGTCYICGKRNGVTFNFIPEESF